MRQETRYGVAILVAAIITTGAAIVHHSLQLLAGIFGIWALALAISLKNPTLWRGDANTSRNASGILAGGTTFGVLSLAQGLGPEIHFGAGVLGFGLVVFGVATGIWMANEAPA
jgi:hypothetical protein